MHLKRLQVLKIVHNKGSVRIKIAARFIKEVVNGCIQYLGKV